MKDQDVFAHIEDLVRQEHELFERAGRERSSGLSTADRQRLSDLSVQLDQYWDLLRQRRARREYGIDPDGAEERDPEVVERYIQ